MPRIGGTKTRASRKPHPDLGILDGLGLTSKQRGAIWDRLVGDGIIDYSSDEKRWMRAVEAVSLANPGRLGWRWADREATRFLDAQDARIEHELATLEDRARLVRLATHARVPPN